MRLLNLNLFLGCLLVATSLQAEESTADDPLQFVDPFIGVDGGGGMQPDACLPFSMVRLGPDTVHAGASAYKSGQQFLGFSENHLSGTGGKGRYCNIRVTPQVGALELTNIASLLKDEYAGPAYYSAIFQRNGVKAELTLSERCGVHRYTFPATNAARILIDVSSTWATDWKHQSDPCVAAWGKVTSDHTVEGASTCQGGWGNAAAYTIYFVAEFDRPFAAFGTWKNYNPSPGRKEIRGTNCGVYVDFNTMATSQIGIRVGISYVSLAKVRKNLAETDRETFEQVRAKARQKWRDYLGKIQVRGGSRVERELFYTALYRTVIMPTDVTGENPRWPSNEPHFWDFYTFWDTWHCNNSLYTLIVPKRESDIIRCLLDIYKHRGWLPDAWIAGEYGSTQGGINSDNVIADAVVKRLKGFDLSLAYEAVKKDATVPSDNCEQYGRPSEYFRRGYLPCESINARNGIGMPVSRTMEYAMNDFAAAQIARAMGDLTNAVKFNQRSLDGFNLFNPQTKFFWARDLQGNWLPGFDPDLDRRSWIGPYYEGTPWQYSCYINHDIQGIINRHGGNEQFITFLDEFFDGNHYNAGNEPDLLMPWLYTYVDRPDKNVDRVHALLANVYHDTRAGWPGNDDAGTMSAWYVFGAMGFFPNAGQDVYLMSSPVFSSITIKLSDGKTFKIAAHNLSPANKYIQSVTLDGHPWNKGWFRHSDIVNGADLVLDMGPTPSAWGTRAAPPPSVSSAGY